MRSGRLRHKVTVQTVSEATDSFGQAIKTWSTYAQPFASVEPLNGREFFTANADSSEVTVRIRLRYLSGLTTKMRVLWDSKYYNIESIIDPAERNAEMVLMCSEALQDDR